ncbi:glycosyltransferase [Veillonella ratti]|uniref:glycosyltransferase n=1 Tax=Veillonella ratti TaxID=103892 RepID=UPI0019CFBA3F|nr:glycosyltransferase [Veillonella ratti]
MRAVLQTKLKNSPVPVYFIIHGINPREKARFIKQAKRCEPYKNIHIKIITLRNDFANEQLSNIDLIEPPVFKPVSFTPVREMTLHNPLTLGFFGQYRREKNIRFFLEAYKKAKFDIPVKLIVQGATAMQEDSDEFEKIIKEYNAVENIEFWHKNLIGPAWEEALQCVDVIIAPYAAERYRYHWSAMLFNAIGFYKPILQSPEMNPEVLANYKIGEALNLNSEDEFSVQLEQFVNSYNRNKDNYKTGLEAANTAFSHEKLIHNILGK